MKRKSNTHKPDYLLLLLTIGLVGFGLIMIASAGAVKSFQLTEGASQYLFFKRQLFFAILGLIALGIFQKINYHTLKKITLPLLVISIILLILVFLPGIGYTVNNAARWIKIGSFTLQASEITKLALVLYLAAWFERKGKAVKDFSLGLIPFIIINVVIALLIIAEPDIGTLGVIIVTALAIYYVAGAKLSHLAVLFAAGISALIVLIKIAPYRLNRFKAFLNPELDPTGIGYQISQALIAIGSGGILGLGLGHSRQKYNYLPEPINDSIFAIIGEELGFIGTVAVILLFLFFAYRGFKIARNASDTFGKLIATGITVWLCFQAFVNIGGMISIIPLTGIPLPFISFGRAALVVSLAAVGILLNISKYTKTQQTRSQQRKTRKPRLQKTKTHKAKLQQSKKQSILKQQTLK